MQGRILILSEVYLRAFVVDTLHGYLGGQNLSGE